VIFWTENTETAWFNVDWSDFVLRLTKDFQIEEDSGWKWHWANGLHI
jgi:hypothetical protein